MVSSTHARRRVPYPGPILAGTVPCPGCDGNPVVYRHTPDFMRIAGQNETFHTIVRARLAGPASRWLSPRHPRSIAAGCSMQSSRQLSAGR